MGKIDKTYTASQSAVDAYAEIVSCGSISEQSRVRGIIYFDGKIWAATAAAYLKNCLWVELTRLQEAQKYQGEILTYNQWAGLNDENRNGLYARIKVGHRGKDYVFLCEKIKIIPGEPGIGEQVNLFD